MDSMYNRYKYILSLIILLIVGYQPLFSQTAPDTTWTEFNETLYDFEQLSNGDIAVTGESSDNVFWGLADSEGNLQWTNSYEFEGNENKAHAIAQTDDEGYIVTGQAYFGGGFGNDRIILVKTNANGDTSWTNTYNGDLGRDVEVTEEGNYLVAGELEESNFYGEGFTVGYIFKANAEGDTMWTKTIGDPNAFDTAPEDRFYDITKAHNDGYMIAGISETNGEDGNSYQDKFGYLMNIDTNGDTLWTRDYLADRIHDIHAITGGGYLLSGNIIEYDNAVSNTNARVIRIDNNGDTLWTKTIRGEEEDTFLSAAETNDGGFILAGFSESYNEDGDEQIWFTKLNSDGDSLWSKNLNQNGVLRDITQTGEGSFLVAGQIGFGGSGNLAKFNQNVATSATPVTEPASFKLKQNYPNPFNPSTKIEFSLEQSSNVTIDVYNMLGEKIKTLVNGRRTAGTYTVEWNGTNQMGAQVSSGMYLYRLKTNQQSVTQKMTLIK